jgi:hypothetical protein
MENLEIPQIIVGSTDSGGRVRLYLRLKIVGVRVGEGEEYVVVHIYLQLLQIHGVERCEVPFHCCNRSVNCRHHEIIVTLEKILLPVQFLLDILFGHVSENV